MAKYSNLLLKAGELFYCREESHQTVSRHEPFNKRKPNRVTKTGYSCSQAFAGKPRGGLESKLS